MKKLLILIAALGLLAFPEVHAAAQDKAAKATQKPVVYREKAGTITATVRVIDLANRIVTVQGGPKDQVVELKVDKKVKNLDRLKVGDVVAIGYYASVAVRVTKPGASPAKETMEKAQVERPGAEARQLTVTATVQEIDRERNSVFLKWPEGAIVGMQVKDPSILEGVNAGDRVEITYVEALAISIEKKNR